MADFHHLWIVEAELEIRNPAAEADTRCERLFAALEKYGSDDTSPYPSQVATNDDGWLECTFPIWAPTKWAAIAAGATVLAEAATEAGCEVGVARVGAGASSEELSRYRDRTSRFETSTGAP